MEEVIWCCDFHVTVYTGIIPFSRLGGFYANLGSAEIFFCHQRNGSSDSTNGK